MIDLTSKLGEINDIEPNKGSKIYPQNQVILDSIMPSKPLQHKCLSMIWVIVSKKSKKKKIFFFTFLNWEKQTWYWEKKLAIFEREWGKNSAPREGQKIP